MICTCLDDDLFFQDRNCIAAYFQSVEVSRRPPYLPGTGVALSVSTMDISVANTGEGTANQSVSKSSASDEGPDAGTGASDTVFETLMAQMLGSIMQNSQQVTPDASQATATGSAVSGKNDSAALIAQAQVPLLPPTDQSYPVSDGQKQADVPTAVAPFSEQFNVDEKVKQNIPSQPKSMTTELPPIKTETAAMPGKPEMTSTSERTGTSGTTPERDDATKKSVQSASNPESGSDYTDYNMILLQQDTDAKTGQGTGEEGTRGKDQNDPSLVKNDFLTLMQQGQGSVQSSVQSSAQLSVQSSVQHQPAFTAIVRNADASSSPAPLQQQGTDQADIFDHTVSIVKDGNQLAVKLEPDGLGKLNINLSLNKGTVSAQIHVSNDATKTLIENNKQQMMNALAGEGLSIGGFSVSLNQKGTWNGNAEGEQGSQGGEQNSASAQQALKNSGSSNALGLLSIFV